MSLFATIRTLLNPPPPDPKRFAVSSPPFNWNGEAVTMQGGKYGPVLVNEATNTYEFDKTRLDISPELTELDKKGLRSRKLNPDGEFAPAYAAAKRYFSKQPFCSREALAEASATDEHKGFTTHTAKDVLAAFNAFLVDKPTF